MYFEGHEIYKINNNWVFDLTEHVGYKIKINRHGKIKEYSKAFKLVDENKQGLEFKCVKYLDGIPLGIVNKSLEVIKAYYREALIYD